MTDTMTNSDIINVLEGIPSENSDVAHALDKASDALAFSQSLWEVFKEQGLVESDVVDYSLMENLFDGLHGEIAAACLFLAEKHFEQVPTMLRAIADVLDKQNEGQEVPMVIAKGYRRLAQRIENTRMAVEAAKAVLVSQEQENAPVAVDTPA